jgi:aryl-alcohol dehydrogenase-like predicted oxidoreductase
MVYREFGNLGWNVSEIGFGAWAIGGDMWGPQNDNDSIQALHKAVDLGVNFIDTAQGYGNGHSEEIIGKFLKERKEEIFVATKIPPVEGNQWPPPENQDVNICYPKEYIIKQCEISLKRLQREYIDVLQFHTWATHFNIQNEWYEAMARLKEEGKIRAIGVSVPDATPDNIIGSIANGRIDSIQVIYNLFEQYPEWNLFPVCEKFGTAVIVRVPFDEGALTGKYSVETKFAEGDVRNYYFRGNNLKSVVKKVDEIKKYLKANHPELSLPEFALRFCLSNRAVGTIIPGIRNVRQAEINTSVSDGQPFDETELLELRKFTWKKDFWHEEVTLD